VPLKEGLDDRSYEDLFKPIMSKVMSVFRPGAVVLQSGGWRLRRVGPRRGAHMQGAAAFLPPRSGGRGGRRRATAVEVHGQRALLARSNSPPAA
jgi:hypothetical protein